MSSGDHHGAAIERTRRPARPDQSGSFELWESELRPALDGLTSA